VAPLSVLHPDDDDGLPVVRPNWRVEPQANLSRNEAATYRAMYHAPRMANMAAVGLKEFSDRAAVLCADDEYLAAYYTQWERRLAKKIIARIERYLDGDDYRGGY
jgi:hypothetical protein